MANAMQPIERILRTATDGSDGLCVLSQVVVIRCYDGIDNYLFRRVGVGDMPGNDRIFNMAWTNSRGEAIAGIPINPYDAVLPNWDNGGWPISNYNMDVLDISDHVISYEMEFDIGFGSTQTTLTIANEDLLFSPECLTYDTSKTLVGTCVSAEMTPLNTADGATPMVIFNQNNKAGDYSYQFIPNYMFKNGANTANQDLTPDPLRFSPLFQPNNIVKIREAYHNPNWDPTQPYDATKPSGHPSHRLIWNERFVGIVSAATPSISEGRPALQIICNDFMKLAAKGTTERAYVPLLVTNDCTIDANGKVDPSLMTQNSLGNPTANKVFYNPYQTSHAIEDIPFGLNPINYFYRSEQLMNPETDGKAVLFKNLDWSPLPAPEVYMGVANIQANGQADGTWANGAIVRWYDSFEPVGRPVKVDMWNGIYMIMDRFFDPNMTGANEHSFISNYGNWSMVIETMVDLASAIDSSDANQLGQVMFGLYVEGSAKVYWDGQEVGSVDKITLADYDNYQTHQAHPIPEMVYQATTTNTAIMQPSDPGLITWFADITPKDNLDPATGLPTAASKSVKYHHLKIVYQCGSHYGFRNILALRWWGRTDVQRKNLIQNASGAETLTIKSRFRMFYESPKDTQLFNQPMASKLFLIDSETPAYATPHPLQGDGVNMDLTQFTQPSSKLVKKDLFDTVSNEWSVGGATPNFLLGSNVYTRKDPRYQNYIHQDEEVSDNSTPLLMWDYANDLPPDPQWYKQTIAQNYAGKNAQNLGGRSNRVPVFGEKVNFGKMLHARIPIAKDDQDWGYNVLLSRGGIEFNYPVIGLGQVFTSNDSTGAARKCMLAVAAKYVYKNQIGSLKVDDIISDILIEDAFGVDRFTSLRANAGVFTPQKELPLYTFFRNGWWELYDLTGKVSDFGILKQSGELGPSVLTTATPAYSQYIKIFKPKIAVAQVQQVTDTLRLDMENAANSFEAIKKLLDQLSSTFYLACDGEGFIRGRFLEQSGLPRLIPPMPPALQPDVRNRQFYAMTALGNNVTLDLPDGKEYDPAKGDLNPGPLELLRETIFSGEVVLDVNIDKSVNPYPNDTNTFQYTNGRKVLAFVPVLLKTDVPNLDASGVANPNAFDPYSVAFQPRDLTARDKIGAYRLYTRIWDSNAGWLWFFYDIASNPDGSPVADGVTVSRYRDYYRTKFPERDVPTYNIFWVIDIDSLGQPNAAGSPWSPSPNNQGPPNGIFDPADLMAERYTTTDPEPAKLVRPLVIGYDYKLEGLQSLALPRDDFEAVTRVLVLGQRNGWSNPDLVQSKDTRIMFTDAAAAIANAGGTLTPQNFQDNAFLPKQYRLNAGDLVAVNITGDNPHGMSLNCLRIKKAISQTSFNGGSVTGFNVGWVKHTEHSGIVNSCSSIYLIDIDNVNSDAQHTTADVSQYGYFCDGWPGDPMLPATNGNSHPSRWGSSLYGSGSLNPTTFTDMKIKDPQKPNGAGWPKLQMYIQPYDDIQTGSNNYTSNTMTGWFCAETPSLGFENNWDGTQWSGVHHADGSQPTTNPSSKWQRYELIRDRVRGGYLSGVSFDMIETGTVGLGYQSKMQPTDDRIAPEGILPSDPYQYFELFTLDFGKEISFGEIGMAVGYAPYAIDATGTALAQISLDGSARFFRWMVQSSGSDHNGAPGVRITVHTPLGFADPAAGTPGFVAAATTWHTSYSATPPVWCKNAVRFEVTHEENTIRSVGTGAATCGFFLQLEIGKIDQGNIYSSGALKGFPQPSAIQWQVIASEQRLITQPNFYRWDESFFKNYPANGQYLRLKVRQIDPIMYSGFLTRSAVPQAFNSDPGAIGLTLAGVDFALRKKLQVAMKGGPATLSITKNGTYTDESNVVNQLYSISWNGSTHGPDGASTDKLAWAPGKELLIDGAEKGIIKVVMQAGPVFPAGANTASATLNVNYSFEWHGKRNVINGEYWYAGVNFLPSFGITADMNQPGRPDNYDQHIGYRWTPWFGALPPIYYQISAISIQKMYVLQRSQIRQDYILQPDPINASPMLNPWYDPKVSSHAQGKPAPRLGYLPKRSVSRKSNNGNPASLRFNHHSLSKNDASAYTEGRAMTTGFQLLQESKVQRQAASVNIIYMPELNPFNTVMVDEKCIQGYVKSSNHVNETGVPKVLYPFGRTFLIEKIHVNKSGPVPQVSITMRDYY